MKPESFNEYCQRLKLKNDFYILAAYFADNLNFNKNLAINTSEETELKIILWEIYQIARWIHDSLNSWNLISWSILLRWLIERIILFQLILGNKDNISANLKIYLDHGLIIAYEWLIKYKITQNEQNYFQKCKEIFESKAHIYKEGKKYNLYKWLIWERKSFEFLFNKFIKSEWDKEGEIIDSLYVLLSLINHWCSQNISLLSDNTFEPNDDVYMKNNIELFCKKLLKVVWFSLNLSE